MSFSTITNRSNHNQIRKLIKKYLKMWKLTRVDYLQTGVTSTKTTRLLPSNSPGTQQKVAVGDKDGVLQVFSVKKGDITYAFKTMRGPPISRLELGGALGTLQDKVFASRQHLVQGYTKKGKLFLDFTTNMTEMISSMSVTGGDLVVTGNHVYNHYFDCVDTNHLLIEDRINDVLALPRDKQKSLVSILACSDRSLRVIRDSSISYKAQLPGPPSVLHLFYNDGGENGDEVLFGTTDGKIGLMQILERHQGPNTKWMLETNNENAVSCLDNFDLTGDGVKDLIVGRQDGCVEVYGYDEGEDAQADLKFVYNCGESVTNAEGGCVGSAGFEEIVVTTFSGWCFGLTTERVTALPSAATDQETHVAQKTRGKIAQLEQELEFLAGRVQEARDTHQRLQETSLQRLQQGQQVESGEVSAIVHQEIKDTFRLVPNDAAYLLTIEVEMPIDNVLLQSDVPVDLLDVEKNSAVVSFSPAQPESGNALLATYRCQAQTTRLEVRVRTIEGQHGHLQVYVTSKTQPKSCQLRNYIIRPLSLHLRTNNDGEALMQLPHNKLRLRGDFSLAEMHNWIAICLPEVPERPPVDADSAEYHFKSAFLNTQLFIEYGRGEASFMSDNISTIAILKDVLSKEATKRHLTLSIDCDVSEASVMRTLDLLHPLLERQLLLAKQVALIEPLEELRAHESDLSSFLSPEYAFILNNADDLNKQFKRQPAQLERLYGMVTDLYIDQSKFKGSNVRNRVPMLLQILDNYDLDQLKLFFAADPNNV